MAVTVSSDLSVNLSEDNNVKKLTEKREDLKESLRKGEPKIMGMSQVVVGFLIICYSIPLHSTIVVKFGVQWWSGTTFIIAGAFALVMEKRNSIKLVFMCLVITVLAALVSLLALALYAVDLYEDSEVTCSENTYSYCIDIEYAYKFSREMKSMLTCLIVVETAVSSTFSYMLYKERRRFLSYSLVN
ncbi:transmembrane protein 176 [Hoplias malabaricus]|uniref:transmembrane protein 176 n=1 Tax=Hoplias malabaricus TaxID=27720 RepID=UPI003462BA0B